MPRTPDPAPAPPGVRTLAEFLHWLGDVPPQRILLRPPAGMANVNDVLRVERQENRLCELVCGALVEKPLGYKESCVAAALLAALEEFVAAKKLGVVTGPEGSYRLGEHLVRIPAVAFCKRGTYPGDVAPGEAAPDMIPQLVAEVPGPGVSSAEVARKLEDYFAAGVKLVWVVDLERRSVAAYSSPTKFKGISPSGSLDAGKILPGFKLPVRALFEHLGAAKRRK
jgi:Uma2 family endonuclease